MAMPSNSHKNFRRSEVLRLINGFLAEERRMIDDVFIDGLTPHLRRSSS
jgi:hypothetical protein